VLASLLVVLVFPPLLPVELGSLAFFVVVGPELFPPLPAAEFVSAAGVMSVAVGVAGVSSSPTGTSSSSPSTPVSSGNVEVVTLPFVSVSVVSVSSSGTAVSVTLPSGRVVVDDTRL